MRCGIQKSIDHGLSAIDFTAFKLNIQHSSYLSPKISSRSTHGLSTIDFLKKLKLDISIIIPVYNNAATLAELLGRLAVVLDKEGQSFEVICVNDGSQDGSWNLLNEIKNKVEFPLRLVDLSQNFGQHKALLCGMQLALGQSMVLLDADLQIPPEEIDLLIAAKKATQADVVYGIFKEKKHSRLRNWGSRFLAWILKKFGTYNARGTSFKLIDKRIAEKVCRAGFEYIFIDELISWHTSNIAYVEVAHLEREGESGYSYFHLVKMALLIILNYTTLPLRLMTYGGLLTGMVCFFLGLFFMGKKYFYGAEIGFTAIIVTILFSAGILLFCLGIIGEYIRKLYFVQLAKPPFTIKEYKE